jgi:hypothetical protein
MARASEDVWPYTNKRERERARAVVSWAVRLCPLYPLSLSSSRLLFTFYYQCNAWLCLPVFVVLCFDLRSDMHPRNVSPRTSTLQVIVWYSFIFRQYRHCLCSFLNLFRYNDAVIKFMLFFFDGHCSKTEVPVCAFVGLAWILAC